MGVTFQNCLCIRLQSEQGAADVFAGCACYAPLVHLMYSIPRVAVRARGGVENVEQSATLKILKWVHQILQQAAKCTGQRILLVVQGAVLALGVRQ